jgi:hypothetical protein
MISTSEYDNPDDGKMLARIEPRAPELIGRTTLLDIENKTGLPNCVTITANLHIFLSIRRNTRGNNATLTWVPPIRCATQLKTTLEDKMVPQNDDRRYRNVILRAQPKFQGVPAYDKVKVWVEEDAGRKLYFARYNMTFIVVL